MDRPARLPADCPRCENRGVLTLDDDRTIACLLCNSWCTLCIDRHRHILPKTSTIGSGSPGWKESSYMAAAKARSFVVWPPVRLQPYCWVAENMKRVLIKYRNN